MYDLRITCLCENNSSFTGNLISEWGLSLLIETKHKTILFDTGKSISVCYNAQLLGIDLNKIDTIVLSHSHQDHTGGLKQLLERINKKRLEIIAHPNVWKEKYNYYNKTYKYAGIPFQQKEIEKFGAIFRLFNKPIKITSEIITSGEIPLKTEYENIESKKKKRLILNDGKFQKDEMLDDQAIFCKTKQGLIIVTGCAHRGIINTIYHAQELTGVKNIFAVIGGSHLIEASQERIKQTIDVLEKLNIKIIGLCHCTGLHAISLLINKLPKQFVNVSTGTILEF